MGFVVHRVRWATDQGVRGWSYEGNGDEPWGFADRYVGVDVVNENIFLLAAPDQRRFASIRGLFADFRLRLCFCDRQNDPLVQLQRSLRAVDLEMLRADIDFAIDDVWDGSRPFMEHYVHWLEAEDLVRCEGTQIADTVLSAEGRAVLHMLDLTERGCNVDTSPAGIREMRLARTVPRRGRTKV